MFVLFVLALCLAPSLQQSVLKTAVEYRRISVSRTIELSSFKGTPELEELSDDEKREAFHYQQTLVIRDSGKDDDKVHRCELIETYNASSLPNLYNNLSSIFNLEVQEVTIDEIFKLMEECDSVDEIPPDNSDVGKDFIMGIETETTEEEMKDRGPNPILNGIYPGTKWCGFGDIASKYHDLDGIRNVDRCCRAHDFCPLKVLSKDEKFDIKNDASYTKSHCLCDEAFHACLKKDKGFAAMVIGNVYFRFLHPECLKGVPENPDEKLEFVEGTRKW